MPFPCWFMLARDVIDWTYHFVFYWFIIHKGLNKTGDILQTTFSNALSLMERFAFDCRFMKVNSKVCDESQLVNKGIGRTKLRTNGRNFGTKIFNTM